MITIRLPETIENQLLTLAEVEQQTKTEIVKRALTEYFARHSQEKSAYELGKEFFGKHSSGETTRSVTYKERLRQILHEKHSR